MLRTTGWLWCAITALWLLCAVTSLQQAAAAELMEQRHWRRPIAIAKAGQWLFVANRKSGTVSVIETASRRVLREVSVGQRLSDLKATLDGRFLLALDEGGHQLIVLAHSQSQLQIEQKLDIPQSPVTLDLAADDARCTIASLWSRQVSIVDLTPLKRGAELGIPRVTIAKQILLPFAPRMQKSLSDGRRLVVADSFGGRLAVLDTHSGQVISLLEIPGHNIRGLSVDRRRGELLIAHQRSRPAVSTSSDSIKWGAVISNLVRVVPMREFDTIADAAAADRPLGGVIYPLGRFEDGAGDPQDIALTAKGHFVVSLSGVSQVAVGASPGKTLTRLAVGRRPTAILIDDDERHAYVVNTLDDSISIIDLNERANVGEVSLGPQPAMGAAELGEQLFFDARVSRDGWFSCQSCHTDGHSNGQLNDNLGDGNLGAPKRVLSLLGVADTKPWAWNGGVVDLHEQLTKSMRTTMRSSNHAAQIETDARALEAYIRTLAPAPALDRAQGTLDAAAVKRGERIFESQKCVSCHTPPLYTSEQAYDVGLHDVVGNKNFNPPSLRGVSQRETFFHDNRATRLIDVLDRFRHGLHSELSPAQRDDLLSFLRSL